jgi:hypothetical protein
VLGDRWYVDETYVKVAGRWRYVYRAVDQYGQITDVYVSARRDTRAARRFFTTALRAHGEPAEAVTDRAPALRAAIDELIPGAFHNMEQYENNRVECDHGRLKARLRPMRGALLHWAMLMSEGDSRGCADPLLVRSSQLRARRSPGSGSRPSSSSWRCAGTCGTGCRTATSKNSSSSAGSKSTT